MLTKEEDVVGVILKEESSVDGANFKLSCEES
jgi:hypothetical protein